MMIFPKGRWVRYSQTKLANAIFTSCLHEKLIETNVKAIVAHPGLSITDLQNTTVHDGGMKRWSTELMMKLAQSREDGAIGIIKSMTDPTVKSGSFIGPGKGMTAFKGKPITFELDPNYKQFHDLLWDCSCNAIDESFDI